MKDYFRKITRIKQADWIGLVLIALQFDFYYLISTEFKLGQGIILCLSLLLMVIYYPQKKGIKNPNTWIILFLALLMVTGAWQAARLFRTANIVGAFLAERVLWAYIPFYFALSRLNRRGIVDNNRLKRLLFISGGIQLFLYFLQWILSSRIIFLHVLAGARYGSARFFFQPILLMLMYCLAFSDFLNHRNSACNAAWMMLVLAEVLIVQKYRMSTVALGVASAMGVAMYRGNLKRSLKYVAIAIVAAVVLLNTTIGQDILRSLRNAGNDNSVNGRTMWRLWALDELKQRPLLGNGFVYNVENYDYGATPVKQIGWSFTPGDHGVLGFIYQYGLLGTLWLVVLLAVQLKRALVVRRRLGNYTYLTYLLFIIVDSYSELYWLQSNGAFALVIFMVMLEADYRKALAIGKGRANPYNV